MTNISLKEITKDNYIDCMRLEVDDSQKAFVATNAWSIAQSKFHPEFIPRAIYDNETIVGFLMYEYDPEPDEDGLLLCWLFRFMIGKQFQGKGYGKKAFQAFLDEVLSEPEERFQRIGLSVEEENLVARRLYESYEFRYEGDKLEEELIYTRPRHLP